MTRFHPLFLAALAVAGARPALAAQAAAPPSTPDAIVEQLFSTFPGANANHPAPPPPAEEVSQLVALNPGRDDAIMAVLNDFQTCAKPAVEAGSARAMRQSIRTLGERKARLLIQFYGGPDSRRFEALSTREAAGETLSAADLAEAQRILDTYPIAEFAAQVATFPQVAMRDEVFIAAIRRCSAEKGAALERRGLRLR
jgi:hypothetical protein